MRIAVIAVLVAAGGQAYGQPAGRYVEEPTGGVAMPTTPLAGEHDARAVVANPGGLGLVRGNELALVVDAEDTSVATTDGQGVGAFWARQIGGPFLPSLGIGAGVEWLRPPRAQLEPDPGQPFRLTVGLARPLGAYAGVGAAWHHYHADGVLDGADTFDVGLSWRPSNYFAAGAVVRDVGTGTVRGVPVQRRYEAEVVLRPLASDALEAGFGGRYGETRRDVDGWLRVSARLMRGWYVDGQVESRALHFLADTGSERDERELRATLGLTLSFGSWGVSSLATGQRAGGASHALGGTLVVRESSAPPPSLQGTPDHIERVDLAGAIDLRALTQLVVRLRAIARDPTAAAVVVTFDGVSSGWATLDELRDELVRVRGAGKLVFAYMVSGTSRDYYVASAANKIYVDPAGGLRLVGMAGTTMYFRGAFEQFGVLPQFEKIAEYKSAPEQFTESGPTAIAARMRNELVDSLWERWLATVSAARRLTREQLMALVDAGPFTAGDLASNTQLVDAVAPPERISELITREIGRVLPVTSPDVERPDCWHRPGIAVIYVEGDITDGKSQSVPVLGGSVAGGETLVAALTAARADPQVGAIVLRIDSPGGSALASELISREVFAARGVKPIICSMSNLAASGGYFVAAGCDVIYAEPMTITGSIGIFYGKFDIAGLIGKLGITTDTYKRGKRADLESMYRPYTADEQVMLMDKLRYMYGRFVGAVAEGRRISPGQVDAIGRGHVWSGAQAMPIKLVDRFGGLGDALDEAKRRMALPTSAHVALIELPGAPPSLLATLGGWLGVTAEPSLGLTDLPAVKQLLQGVPASLLVDPTDAQMRLPFDIHWE